MSKGRTIQLSIYFIFESKDRKKSHFTATVKYFVIFLLVTTRLLIDNYMYFKVNKHWRMLKELNKEFFLLLLFAF